MSWTFRFSTARSASTLTQKKNRFGDFSSSPHTFKGHINIRMIYYLEYSFNIRMMIIWYPIRMLATYNPASIILNWKLKTWNIMKYSDIQILALVIFVGEGTQCLIARNPVRPIPSCPPGADWEGTGSICMGMSWKHLFLCTQMVAFSSNIRWLSMHNHLF